MGGWNGGGWNGVVGMWHGMIMNVGSEWGGWKSSGWNWGEWS